MGKVLAIHAVDQTQTSPDGTIVGWRHKVVIVEVTEDFSGSYSAGQRVEVATGFGGGDCGYPFQEGETYLIDGTPDQDTLSTSICSATDTLSAAGMKLRTLRAQAAGRRSPDLSGTVLQYSTNRDQTAPAPRPLAGIPVTITGLDGAVARSAITEADGVFEVASLPGGSYSVHFTLPDHMTSYFAEDTIGISVPENFGIGAGCQVSLQAFSDGKLAGRVVNSRGVGVPGYVSAYPYVQGEKPAYNWSAMAQVTEASGEFTLRPLDAGAYWLVFSPEQRPDQRWYYPGRNSRDTSVPVQVTTGQITEGLTIVVP